MPSGRRKESMKEIGEEETIGHGDWTQRSGKGKTQR